MMVKNDWVVYYAHGSCGCGASRAQCRRNLGTASKRNNYRTDEAEKVGDPHSECISLSSIKTLNFQYRTHSTRRNYYEIFAIEKNTLLVRANMTK